MEVSNGDNLKVVNEFAYLIIWIYLRIGLKSVYAVLMAGYEFKGDNTVCLFKYYSMPS